jgi:exosortase
MISAPSRTKEEVLFPRAQFAWFGLLLIVCYAPVLAALVKDWMDNPDMGHGFFVPLASGYIVWQRRTELMALPLQPSGWGLLVVLSGMCQLIVATLGSELFLARTAFVVSIIGVTWMLGGNRFLQKTIFPLFLLFFMVPIPAVLYNSITFPLQILASKLAEASLVLMGIPVLREGNILELSTQTLSVVDACSGIRSLLSLTFFSLVYGYFFEKRTSGRVLLFLLTVPIALIANGSRVTITALLGLINPDLAEGVFHESTGMVIFFVALAMLLGAHRLIVLGENLLSGRAAQV